jgi:nicotinamidase-related amidase
MEDALLVIDMLNDFILDSGVLYIPDARKIIPFIRDEIFFARQKKIPVIYICDSHKEADEEFELYPPHCIESTFGSLIIEELSPVAGDIVVKKTRFSGFYKTELDEILREKNCKTLTITGVLTNICVLYTACDASCRDYKIVIKKRCVASNSKYLHDFALKQLNIVHKARII